ncbi:hypothetical protein JTE90_024972 [Oedothorax gibbosus]|uniref:Uncharacterized protein n=1 Tax=Oedothorax gibbosus TaxID=931172 RepID=A0AAV6VU05_9ARAC|nr:hypothetical protein JTE90_024972 [Oedothorax gibbosus]
MIKCALMQFELRCVRSCRDNLNRLLKAFITEDRSNLRKSGTEEEKTTKKQLLQNFKVMKMELAKEKDLRRKLPKKSLERRWSLGTISDCLFISMFVVALSFKF